MSVVFQSTISQAEISAAEWVRTHLWNLQTRCPVRRAVRHLYIMSQEEGRGRKKKQIAIFKLLEAMLRYHKEINCTCLFCK